MVTTGDFIRVIDKQAMTNVAGPILNVYFFEVLTMTGFQPLVNIADSLETWFKTSFLQHIKNVQSPAIQHVGLQVDNMSLFETDFVDINYVVALPGAAGTEYGSSTATYSFQLTRTFRTTRHGRKAIGGIAESLVANNLPAGTGTATAALIVDTIGQMTTVDLGPAGEMELIPVIAKTPVAPATLPTVFNPVSGAAFRGIGTQNTRKQLLS